MTVLSGRVRPTTDTPGAIAAGVPEYIEKLLADWAWPDERKPIIAGLDLLDAKSMADNKVPGAKATPEQQDALLTAALPAAQRGARAIVLEKFELLGGVSALSSGQDRQSVVSGKSVSVSVDLGGGWLSKTKKKIKK